jgi:electron transport complex protein RnfC
MARAKAQREAAQPKNTEAVTFEQAHEMAEIDARREAVAPSSPLPPDATLP